MLMFFTAAVPLLFYFVFILSLYCRRTPTVLRRSADLSYLFWGLFGLLTIGPGKLVIPMSLFMCSEILGWWYWLMFYFVAVHLISRCWKEHIIVYHCKREILLPQLFLAAKDRDEKTEWRGNVLSMYSYGLQWMVTGKHLLIFTPTEKQRKNSEQDMLYQLLKTLCKNRNVAAVFVVLCCLTVPSQLYSGEIDNVLLKHFSIYLDNSGELEILNGSNDTEINNLLLRVKNKQSAVRAALSSDFTKTIPEQCSNAYIAVESAAAKHALQKNDIDEAVKSVQCMLILSQKMCDANKYDLRIYAARIRLKTMSIMRDVLLHPKCGAACRTELYALMQTQLDRWTKEPQVWTEYLDEGNTVYKFILNAKEDNSQRIFQSVMRRVIPMSELPFYRRQDLLKLFKEKLQTCGAIEKGLLEVIPETMELLALERTQCEMIYLGLSSALDGPSRQKGAVPLTGGEYEIKLTTDGVMVTYPGCVKAVYVRAR